MQITSIYRHNQSYVPQKPINTSFTSLNRASTIDPTKMINTAFFRDLQTLEKATEYLTQFFPRGTNVLHYACSDGSELLSLFTLLKIRQKEHLYKLIGLDIDAHPLSLANKGRYVISSRKQDGFLLKNPSDLNGKERRLQSNLLECLIETACKNDDGVDKKLYFAKKNKLANHIEFRPPEQGNILDIHNFEPEKNVGAVFFRNALYFLTNNRPISETYNKAVIPELIEKVHSRLERNGIFVLGSYPNEHVYLSSKGTEILALEKEIIRSKKFRPSHVRTILSNALHRTPFIWQKI